MADRRVCDLPVPLASDARTRSDRAHWPAAGALVSGHPYVAGAVITSAWLAATRRGIRHLQSARKRSLEENVSVGPS